MFFDLISQLFRELSLNLSSDLFQTPVDILADMELIKNYVVLGKAFPGGPNVRVAEIHGYRFHPIQFVGILVEQGNGTAF